MTKQPWRLGCAGGLLLALALPVVSHWASRRATPLPHVSVYTYGAVLGALAATFLWPMLRSYPGSPRGWVRALTSSLTIALTVLALLFGLTMGPPGPIPVLLSGGTAATESGIRFSVEQSVGGLGENPTQLLISWPSGSTTRCFLDDDAPIWFGSLEISEAEGTGTVYLHGRPFAYFAWRSEAAPSSITRASDGREQFCQRRDARGVVLPSAS